MTVLEHVKAAFQFLANRFQHLLRLSVSVFNIFSVELATEACCMYRQRKNAGDRPESEDEYQRQRDDSSCSPAHLATQFIAAIGDLYAVGAT